MNTEFIVAMCKLIKEEIPVSWNIEYNPADLPCIQMSILGNNGLVIYVYDDHLTYYHYHGKNTIDFDVANPKFNPYDLIKLINDVMRST